MAYSRLIQIFLIVGFSGLSLQVAVSQENEREVRVLSADRTLPEGLALRVHGGLELAPLTFQNGRRSIPYPIPGGATAVDVVRPLSSGETEPVEVEILKTLPLKDLGNRVLLLFVSTGGGWKISALRDDTQTQPVGALVILNGTDEALLARVGKKQIEVPAGRIGAPTDIREFAETRRMVTSEIMDEETGNLTTEEFEVVENGVMVTLRRRTGPHGGHLYESPITASATGRALMIVHPPLEKDNKRYRILLVPEHFPPEQATVDPQKL